MLNSLVVKAKPWQSSVIVMTSGMPLTIFGWRFKAASAKQTGGTLVIRPDSGDPIKVVREALQRLGILSLAPPLTKKVTSYCPVMCV